MTTARPLPEFNVKHKTNWPKRSGSGHPTDAVLEFETQYGLTAVVRCWHNLQYEQVADCNRQEQSCSACLVERGLALGSAGFIEYLMWELGLPVGVRSHKVGNGSHSVPENDRAARTQVSPCAICIRYARSTPMRAIPQGFRRRFVRGRSQPTSANPVSRSESVISAPYNHRQRHPGSSSSTTTSDRPSFAENPRTHAWIRGFRASRGGSIGRIPQGFRRRSAPDAA